MATVITMPQLGLTMIEGAVSAWLKKEGDRVEKGETIAELISDKSSIDFESRAAGVLLKITTPAGASAKVGAPICVVGEAGEDVSAALAAFAGPPAASGPEAGRPPAPAADAAPVVAVMVEEDRLKASPAARKYARDHGVDLARVAGTGPGGRIVEKDVVKAAAASATPAALKAAAALGVAVPETPGRRARVEDVEAVRADVREALTPIQKITARRLAESKQTVPHFYLTAEADCGELRELRGKLAPAVERRHGTRLSYNDLIVRAAALALERHPRVNASYAGDEVVLHGEANIGLAVGVKDGLVVPVLRRASRKGVGEISVELAELVRLARSGRLPPDAYGCGTFTISNLGMYGVDSFQAIVNPPESVIMALGSMREKPVMRGGQVVGRPMMSVTLSCDHRIVDGVQGAKFLSDLIGLLENPVEILA